MSLPVKLEQVQKLMAAGDARARKIYETIGVYFGYNIATYADFYEVRNLLVLGRVMTGEGGDLILSTATEVLRAEFPEVAERIRFHIPDEKEKRHGQAIAAASLPSIPDPGDPLMQFHQSTADFFVPDGTAPEAAIARTTHLCIAAHQDDIEIMAYHGIAECFGRKDKWFTGVVVTNGAGSPRSGIYGDYTDEEMQKVRVLEQRKAAYVGEYACQIQLAFTSSEVKNPKETAVVEDLAKILLAANPEYVYLHNPADKL